jgi:hypothetical protein
VAGRKPAGEGEAVSLTPTVDEAMVMPIAEGLVIKWVDVAALKEQDVNAQQMQPHLFDRLTENIRIRGMLESLPYCHQPNGEGPISVVSGHHRTRGARAAGIRMVPAIVDYIPMARSRITAKQIAHNELHGSPDEEILRQMVATIDNVDDMLMTGLDEEYLPAVEADDTTLLIPHAEFDWRMITMTFLPKQMKDFQDVIALIDKDSELVGIADLDQFRSFSTALLDYGRIRNIKSMSAVVYALTRLAREEIERHEAEANQKAPDVEDGSAA